jgi:hypothetical protein
MCSINCSLSFFNSGIKSKRFVYHLEQQHNLLHFPGFNTVLLHHVTSSLQTFFFFKKARSLESQTLLWGIKLQNGWHNSPLYHYQSSWGSQQQPLEDHVSQLPSKNKPKIQINVKKKACQCDKLESYHNASWLIATIERRKKF